MRALPLEFPDDPVVRAYPFQYLFGETLLVAPVTEPGIERQAIYLPQGDWRDFWTGERFSGQQVIWLDMPLDRIAVFARGSDPLIPE